MLVRVGLFAVAADHSSFLILNNVSRATSVDFETYPNCFSDQVLEKPQESLDANVMVDSFKQFIKGQTSIGHRIQTNTLKFYVHLGLLTTTDFF